MANILDANKANIYLNTALIGTGISKNLDFEM